MSKHYLLNNQLYFNWNTLCYILKHNIYKYFYLYNIIFGKMQVHLANKIYKLQVRCAIYVGSNKYYNIFMTIR